MNLNKKEQHYSMLFLFVYPLWQNLYNSYSNRLISKKTYPHKTISIAYLTTFSIEKDGSSQE